MNTLSDWQTDYKRRLTTPEDAVSRLESGQRLVMPTLAGAPPALVRALGTALRAGSLPRVRISAILPGRDIAEALHDESLANRFEWDSLFCGGSDRHGVIEGLYDMTPMQFGQMPRIMKSMPVDAVMTLVSPPDDEGYMSVGISVDYTKSLLDSVAYRVVEVNPNVPRVYGDCRVHVSAVEALVESDDPIFELPNPPIKDADEAIGGFIAERIPDGATIQLGYGAVPSAVARHLLDHKNLGIHTEMFVDNMRMLMEKGVVDNTRKSLHPGKTLYTFCAGTRETYQFLHENPVIEGYPVEYTNNPSVIAQNRHMVSINATIAVDLTGQACSESIGPMQYSGTGGQLDFVRGAGLAEGGQSFIGTHATAKDGAVSSIVVDLPVGSVVTVPRTDMDMVVTEYGVAELRGRSLRERAQALIAIAHPKFRDALQEEARKRGLGPR